MRYLHTLLILALFIFTILSINLPPFPSVSSLPYQAHSFNDAAYVRQLLRRGVKYFKLDASIANRQSCTKNSNWNPSSKCFKTPLYSQQYCCIAMRGDTSGNFNFDYPFSTMDNFLDMVQQHIIENGISQILFFAINHQFNFQFSNQLVENSTYRMAKLMEKYPKLYFGFGSDNFIFQYDRVCRKEINNTVIKENNIEFLLQKLNQQACNEKRKFISQSKIFLQSGAYDPSDPRDYYGRYRNFNVFYKEVDHFCENGFPLWVKKHPEFPLIFWQPSDQRQIQKVIETFLTEKCKKRHGRDIDGLAITSNIDPQVFEFYLKRVNQTSSASPMAFYPNNEKIALPHARNFLSKLLANNTEFLIFGQQDNLGTEKRKGTNLEIILMTETQNSEKVYEIKRKELPPSMGTIKIIEGNGTFIVVQSPLQNQQSGTVSMTILNSNLQFITTTQVDRYFDVSYLDGYYYILRQTANPTIFNVLKTNDFNKISIILSFSLLLQKSKSIESFLVTQDSEGKVRYFLSGSLAGSVWVSEIRNDNIYKSINVGFGKNSKLTMKANGMLLITMQNGPCNSGVQINNGDVPLCDFFRFPEFKPMTSTQGTITLIQVTLKNLMQYMQKQSNQPVTPCTEKFVHSKVFNGKNVRIVDLWSRLFFTTQYVHISQQGLLNSLFCAPSNFERLKNNQKGLLGAIWSRGNTGDSQIATFLQKITKEQLFQLSEQ